MQIPVAALRSWRFSMMAALDRPREGVIRYDGTPLTEIRIAQYRRNCVTTIVQRFNLLRLPVCQCFFS